MIPVWISASLPLAKAEIHLLKAGEPIRDKLAAYAPGPIELQEANGNLISNFWAVVYLRGTKEIQLLRLNQNTELWEFHSTLLVAPKEVESLGFCFDQTGNVIVPLGYSDGSISIFWYNPETQLNELRVIGLGTTPVVAIDDVKKSDTPEVEIALFYVRDNKVIKRNQSDRWAAESQVGIEGTNLKLKQCGLRANFRFQLALTAKQITAWPV